MLSGSGGWGPVGDGTQVSASVLAGKDIHPRLTPVAMILADSSMSRRFSSVMLVRSSSVMGLGFLLLSRRDSYQGCSCRGVFMWGGLVPGYNCSRYPWFLRYIEGDA